MSRILIVDDDISVANSLSRLLDAYGFQTVIANNGEEALVILKSSTDISVVVSDQRMPKMTGSELFVIMSEDFPDIRRILITGYTDLESIRAAVNTGQIFRFLLKPWDDSELIGCIEDGIQSYEIIKENRKLKDQLIQANVSLEEKVERKTRVLNMNIMSLQRYEKIVEQLPVGIVCVSKEGMVVLANNQFCSDFNFTSAVEGRPYQRVLPNQMHPLVNSAIPDNTYLFSTQEGNYKSTVVNLILNNTEIGQLFTIQANT